MPPGTVVETLTGNTGGPVGPNGANNINVVGDGIGITVAGSPGTNTLTISMVGGGPEVEGLDGDFGSATPVGGVIDIITNVATLNAGSTTYFIASGNTVQLNVTDGNGNTVFGKDCGTATLSAMGGANTIFGSLCGDALTSGSSNTIIGRDCAGNLINGIHNIIIGVSSGSNYNSNESSNILIGSSIEGVTGESNVIRIGDTTGTGPTEFNKCFIAGIDGRDVGSVATVVTESGDQLGTAVLTAGTGISITPGSNIITIASSGTETLAYTNVNTTPYIVLTTDEYISVDSSGGAITIQLPNAATLGKTFTIKDRTGSAATFNITVTTVGGAVNIDGATTFVMNTNYEAITVIGNGSSYEIF